MTYEPTNASNYLRFGWTVMCQLRLTDWICLCIFC